MNIETPMTGQELKKFGVTTAVIFVGLFGLFLPWLFEYKWPVWPWIIASILSTTAIISPRKLQSVYKIWILIGTKLGWINSRIILGVMFFLMFMPLGFLMRLFGYDPLRLKRNKDSSTYRVDRTDSVLDVIGRMEHPY